MSKTFQADFPFADVGMPIHARAQTRFRIVEMKGHDLLQAE